MNTIRRCIVRRASHHCTATKHSERAKKPIVNCHIYAKASMFVHRVSSSRLLFTNKDRIASAFASLRHHHVVPSPASLPIPRRFRLLDSSFFTTKCCVRPPQQGIKKPRKDSQVAMPACRNVDGVNVRQRCCVIVCGEMSVVNPLYFSVAVLHRHL